MVHFDYFTYISFRESGITTRVIGKSIEEQALFDFISNIQD